MIKLLLILISFIIIAISVKSMSSEKNISKFDYILNYKLEEESMEPLDNNLDILDNKEEKIRQLINSGYQEEQICKELNIGRGELLLIKKCYKIS